MLNKRSSPYPPGVLNVNGFTAFNALAVQITMGAPVLLYAKGLGASATLLGFIAALASLLTVCQIPTAHFMGRVGYRGFILYGWGLRTVCIFLLSAIPLMAFLGGPGKLLAMVLALFVFNLLRSISLAAWLPWLTELIPENVRGRFLSRDQIFMHAGFLVSLGVGAAMLYGRSSNLQFALLFLVGAVATVASLLFLRKVPDVEAREAVIRSGARVPWREIVFYPPFFRLVLFALLVAMAYSTGGVFNVPFMKSRLGFSDSRIMFYDLFYYSGALMTLPFVGRVLERTGSKLVMQITMGVFCLIQAGWWLMAADMIAPSPAFVVSLRFLAGVSGANFGLAITRLMMNTMPSMGRSHFFAFFTVIASLGTGLAPILWGMQIDACNGLHAATGPLDWNKYSLYYFAVLVITVITWALAFFLHEKESLDGRLTMRDLLLTMKLKRLSRLWMR